MRCNCNYLLLLLLLLLLELLVILVRLVLLIPSWWPVAEVSVVFRPAGPGGGSLGATSVAVAHHRAQACAAVLESAGYRIASSGSPRAGNGRVWACNKDKK